MIAPVSIRLLPPDARVAFFFPVDWPVRIGIFNLGVEAFGFLDWIRYLDFP